MPRAEHAGAASRRQVRRGRFLLAGAVLLAAGILVAWFPGHALLSQRTNESAAARQLAQLHQEDSALAKERSALSDSSEIARIARQQYQLVNPGQQAYTVLPPSKSTETGAPYAGDPGLTGPVAPSGTSLVAPSSSHPAVSSHGTTHGTGGSESTLERMLHTLEFWR